MHVEMVQYIQDGYIGRDISNMAYMDSIGEDEDELMNNMNVDMMYGADESRDDKSPQKSFSTLASQFL